MTRLCAQYATMIGMIRQIKVLYCSDSCLAGSLSRKGKNSMIEMTNVMIERARLRAMSTYDMLVSRSLRGYTTGRFDNALRRDEVAMVEV